MIRDGVSAGERAFMMRARDATHWALEIRVTQLSSARSYTPGDRDTREIRAGDEQLWSAENGGQWKAKNGARFGWDKVAF